MKPPSVVLFYDHVALLSGGEILLWHLVSNLNREKFLPVVVLGEDGPLRVQLEKSGVETHVLPLPGSIQNTRKDDLNKSGIFKRLGSVYAVYLYTRRLSRFIRRRRADIVHTNSLKADFIGGIAGRLARKPVIWHLHDCIHTAYLPNAAVILFRFLARVLPSHIISVSQAVEDTLHLPPKFPATVVHNGIPQKVNSHSTEKEEEPKSSLLVGIVGRITPWKGQHVFIRAAAMVLERFPETRFQIVGSPLFGEDEYWEELQQLARELKLEHALEFMGFRSDVLDLVANFDLFVHASTAPEPFGIVIIEAMMEGKPVVATRGGGVPEIVQDGCNGLLVPMGDSEAMAEAIIRLIENPEQMKRMGRKGHQLVQEKFLIGNTVNGVEDVYQEMLAR